LLTVITQIGGVVFIIALLFSRYWSLKFKFKIPIIFLVLYTCFTILIIPILAPQFGREKIKHTDRIKPTFILTDFLNRNYVRPELNLILKKVSDDIKSSGVQINYLDANFPFFDGFPLLPHLSHSDGKKLDLSLVYTDIDGKISIKQKSNSGYGIYEGPKESEYNQIDRCKSNGYWQYDFPKYLTLGNKNKHLVYSNKYTKLLTKSILKHKSIGKIFIEPHLKQQMNINDNRIRFHGCKAVRHDDHIHIQLR